MATEPEKLEAIVAAVKAAQRRRDELKKKLRLTRAEQFELDMAIDCIKRGVALFNANRGSCPACTKGEFPHRNCILR